MISYFDDQYPSRGEKFICRASSATLVAEQVRKGRFITIYAPAGYGKRTLVRAAKKILDSDSRPPVFITLDLFNITDKESLTALYAEAFRGPIESYNREALLPLDINLDNIGFEAAIGLPSLLGSLTGKHYVVYFKEFQNILGFEGGEDILKIMERNLGKSGDAALIATGSQLNRMKEIFEVRRLFYRTAVHIPLEPLSAKECMAYLRSGFLRSGKNIEDDISKALYLCSKGFPQVVNRLARICDLRAVGYINRLVLGDAVETYLNEDDARHRFTMSCLTPNQINLLRAVCDGAQKFSSRDILDRYHLNSSANVFRIKDALRKKEIVTFDEQDRAEIIDPMFELWLKKRYFAR